MTPAERKQRERDTRREAGLVRLEVWVRPEVREKVRDYAEKMTRRALKGGRPVSANSGAPELPPENPGQSSEEMQARPLPR